jgi:hypothetical protein
MNKSFKQFLDEEEKTAVFTFGRLNPPTTGHQKLLDKLASVSRGNQYFAFLSQSQDSKKNPLSYSDKIKHTRKLFPKHGRAVVADKSVRNVFDAAAHLYNKGFNNIVMVVGSDRVREFDAMLKNYNGTKARHGFYNFKSIKVVSAGDRDPDADDVSGMSASKQRENARKNDFATFLQGLPKGTSTQDARKLFNDVRKGMGLKESHFKNHIDLEPVSNIREKYVSGDLLSMGDKVITKNGNKGIVSWLGSNYVMVEFFDGTKARKWVTDVEVLKEEPAPLVPKLEPKPQVNKNINLKKFSINDPIAKAKRRISKEKNNDKLKHDRILDKARLRAARLKNKETK